MTESPYAPPQSDVDASVSADSRLVEAPREVRLAIGLLIGNYLLGWIGTAVNWEYHASLSLPLSFWLGQAIGLLIAVWIYYKIYRGRNWARIVYLILQIIGTVSLLIPQSRQFLSATPPLGFVVLAVGFLISVVALWLLFFSPGRHWFNERRRANVI